MAYELLPDHLSNYLDGLVPPRSPEMQVMESYARETGFPIVGAASGYLCYQTARLAGRGSNPGGSGAASASAHQGSSQR